LLLGTFPENMKNSILWGKPPKHFVIQPDEVHLWRAYFNRLKKKYNLFKEYLSDPEKTEAARFGSEEIRLRYILSRGFVRRVLGFYLGANPASLEFSGRSSGKPYLQGVHKNSLHFNLSHSGNIILLGISRQREIGVDVELQRDIEQPEKIIGRLFLDDEKKRYVSLVEKKRMKFFFDLWTQKEAQVKCSGRGLFNSKGTASAKKNIGDNPSDGALTAEASDQQISTRKIKLSRNYSCAIAVAGTIANLCFFEWD